MDQARLAKTLWREGGGEMKINLNGSLYSVELKPNFNPNLPKYCWINAFKWSEELQQNRKIRNLETLNKLSIQLLQRKEG